MPPTPPRFARLLASLGIAAALAACSAAVRPDDAGLDSTDVGDVAEPPDAPTPTDAGGIVTPRDVPVSSSEPSCAVRGTPGCGVVEVGGGTFQMGDNDEWNAAPVVTVTVGAFAMDAYEVTVARFRAFWNAGHPEPSGPIVHRVGSIVWAGRVASGSGRPTAGCQDTTTPPATAPERPTRCATSA